MLLPIGLACFVLPIPFFGVRVLIETGNPKALILLIPAVFSVVMYVFYRYAVRCSRFGALNAAAWNLVGWLQLSIFLKYLADTTGMTQLSLGTEKSMLAMLTILGGLQCILWFIIKPRRTSPQK